MAEIDITNLTTNKFRVLDPLFSVAAKKSSSRNRNTSKISTIVLHWTAGSSFKGAVETLYGKKLGYHFIIDTDGTIIQTDQLNRRVPHAGNSYGPEGKDVNDYSIGISIVASGAGQIKSEQVASVKVLILDLLSDSEFKNNIKWITGHHQISPGRKIDPYDFPFDATIKEINSNGYDLKYWRAGMPPFPAGLKDCKCDGAPLQIDGIDWCRNSIGKCIGQGSYSYKPESVTTSKADADKINEISSGVGDTSAE